MVVAQMGLVERDYFGLVFCEDDEQKTQVMEIKFNHKLIF